MSWYITLRHDSKYSQTAETASFMEFVKSCPEILIDGAMSFCNSPEYPWLSGTIVTANKTAGFVESSRLVPRFSMVDLVCGDSADCNTEGWYYDLASRIAKYLGWEAVDHDGRRFYPFG